jgi:hypothetical protein
MIGNIVNQQAENENAVAADCMYQDNCNVRRLPEERCKVKCVYAFV